MRAAIQAAHRPGRSKRQREDRLETAANKKRISIDPRAIANDIEDEISAVPENSMGGAAMATLTMDSGNKHPKCDLGSCACKIDWEHLNFKTAPSQPQNYPTSSIPVYIEIEYYDIRSVLSGKTKA